jgi:hypothetical protein
MKLWSRTKLYMVVRERKTDFFLLKKYRLFTSVDVLTDLIFNIFNIILASTIANAN